MRAAAAPGPCATHVVECALFGVLISATDPVATIAVFKSFNVHDAVFNLVFGESVLNDAVAVVLFRTVNKFAETGAKVTTASVFHAMVCGRRRKLDPPA